MGRFKDVLDLLDKGYRPYNGRVPEAFYAECKCPDRKKGDWFTRPWSEEHKHSRYVCMGCKRRCIAVDPEGWQLLLPISKRRPSMVIFMPGAPLTVEELLHTKMVLRVDEAAWALNLSTKRVYEMVQEGLLDQAPGLPVRVTSGSVRACLEPG